MPKYIYIYIYIERERERERERFTETYNMIKKQQNLNTKEFCIFYIFFSKVDTNAVNPRFTSFTFNPCYLSHSFYILGSTLHANLLTNNQYKAKKSIVCNSYLNKLKMYKTSVWLHNFCVKLQTGSIIWKMVVAKNIEIIWTYM